MSFFYLFFLEFSIQLLNHRFLRKWYTQLLELLYWIKLFISVLFFGNTKYLKKMIKKMSSVRFMFILIILYYFQALAGKCFFNHFLNTFDFVVHWNIHKYVCVRSFQIFSFEHSWWRSIPKRFSFCFSSQFMFAMKKDS